MFNNRKDLEVICKAVANGQSYSSIAKQYGVAKKTLIKYFGKSSTPSKSEGIAKYNMERRWFNETMKEQEAIGVEEHIAIERSLKLIALTYTFPKFCEMNNIKTMEQFQERFIITEDFDIKERIDYKIAKYATWIMYWFITYLVVKFLIELFI